MLLEVSMSKDTALDGGGGGGGGWVAASHTSPKIAPIKHPMPANKPNSKGLGAIFQKRLNKPTI